MRIDIAYELEQQEASNDLPRDGLCGEGAQRIRDLRAQCVELGKQINAQRNEIRTLQRQL